MPSDVLWVLTAMIPLQILVIGVLCLLQSRWSRSGSIGYLAIGLMAILGLIGFGFFVNIEFADRLQITGDGISVLSIFYRTFAYACGIGMFAVAARREYVRRGQLGE